LRDNPAHTLKISMSKLKPFSASSYIHLLQWVINKNAVINIQNNDQKCFLWCITAAFYPVDNHPYQVLNYVQYENEMMQAMRDISFPVAITHISKFEKQYNELLSNNKININVNAYDESNLVCPLHISEMPIDTTQIDLLYLSNKTTPHYCLIKNFSRLVRCQTTEHEHKYYYCKRCLSQFNTEGKLLEHLVYCKKFEASRTIMLNPGQTIKFKKLNSLLESDVIIIADFECFLKHVQKRFNATSHAVSVI